MRNLAMILIVAVVLTSGCLGGDDTVSDIPTTTTGGTTETVNTTPYSDSIDEQTSESMTHLVEMGDEGFSPRTLTVSPGDTVEFANVGTRGIWPASDSHPTHREYPGSGMDKCGTDEEDMIFDSCGEVAPGESWSFVFAEEGTWDYHDHRRSSNGGTIIVE